MNKLTDSEIVKALEVHSNDKYDNCEGCPYLKNDCCEGFTVYSEPYREVLDLINRQKAEIEELRADNNYLFETMPHMKSEAIKEFAEKLKENAIDIDVSYGYGKEHYTEAVAVIEIDNLVEEMVGESNAQFTMQNSQLELLREKCLEHQDFHKGDDGKFRGYIAIEDLDYIINEVAEK